MVWQGSQPDGLKPLREALICFSNLDEVCMLSVYRMLCCDVCIVYMCVVGEWARSLEATARSTGLFFINKFWMLYYVCDVVLESCVWGRGVGRAA